MSLSLLDRFSTSLLFTYCLSILTLWQCGRYKYEAVEDGRAIRFGDLWWVFLVSLAASAMLLPDDPRLNALVLAGITLLFLLVWLDALVMNQFTIQINAHAAKMYLRNLRHFRNETHDSWRTLIRRPMLMVLPLSAAVPYALFVHDQIAWLKVISPVLAAYTLFNLARPARSTTLFTAALLLLLCWQAFATQAGGTPAKSIQRACIRWIAGTGAIGLFSVWLVRGRLHGAFFTSPSLLELCGLISKRRRPTKGMRKAKDEEIIEVPYALQAQSDHFGKCSGSSIILVTLESVSRYHLAPHAGRGAHMPVFEKLAQHGVSSRRHFVISPNTNNSLFTLYNGDYYQNPTFPHLRSLHAQGYKSVMIVPQDSVGFDLDELLGDIGFQHVIDLNCFENYNVANTLDRKHTGYLVDDLEFFGLAFKKLQEILQPGEKAFLHIMNSQTHPPYMTFRAEETEDPNERYVRSMEEADASLGEFLEQLEDLLERPPIVVYTADHGQSLGEMGYKAHSTAITREQVIVPFALAHPSMTRKEVPFSTHFDVFPTLFDLLGMNIKTPCLGRSLMLPDRKLNDILFSETRHGDTPSCFGHVSCEAKIFFDVSLQRFYLMDLEDTILKTLGGEEFDYYNHLLFTALSRRGLIDRTKHVEDVATKAAD